MGTAGPVLFVSAPAVADALGALDALLARLPGSLRGLALVAPSWEASRPLVGGRDDGLVGTTLALLEQRGLLPAAAPLPDDEAAEVASRLTAASGLPVVRVSIAPLQSPRYHHLIGRALRPLAERGIALLALGALSQTATPITAARALGEWIEARLAAGDITALLDYRRHAPDVWANQPTGISLLPLFVALGATRPGQPWRRLALDGAPAPSGPVAFASGLAPPSNGP